MDARLIPLTSAAIAAALLISPSALGAQVDEPLSPEEIAERAEEAENAPLFQTHEPLVMTLRTDIEWLRDERNDSVEVEGTVTFVEPDGSVVTKPVDTRGRGEFRLSKDNCNFPPLRLDFPRSEMEGTVFEGQNRLKLVTPCHDSRDDYQRYVLDEYLAYRVLNLLTPYSNRVRLVEITYEDIEDDYDTRTKIGFLIEADDAMAWRNRAELFDVEEMDPRLYDGDQAVIASMFAYMIGFPDWSSYRLHNIKVIRTDDGRFIPVPYDFDFSGLVDPRYATVPPQLEDRIRNVRQRTFWGFCRPELQYEPVAALFGSKRQEIEELYRSFELYDDPDDAEDALDYYEDFWEVIDDPGEFEDEILDDCRDIGL